MSYLSVAAGKKKKKNAFESLPNEFGYMSVKTVKMKQESQQIHKKTQSWL